MDERVRRRPVLVAVVAVVLIAVGCVMTALLFTQSGRVWPITAGWLAVLVLRLMAIVCGVWLWRGADWARWCSLAWMALHVGIAALHTPRTLIAHTVIFLLIAYGLLNRETSRYFREQG